MDRANQNGQFTGYQTVNNLADSAQVGRTLDDALEHNAVFVELYQKDLTEGANLVADFDGHSIGSWDASFHRQRRGGDFRDKAGDPFPFVHGHTFARTDSASSGNETLQYVISPVCADNPQIGKIHIFPD